MGMDYSGIKRRSDIGNVVNDLGLDGPGVEIGVRFGQFSVRTLNTTNLTPYYLVDPWKHYPEHVYTDSCNDAQTEQDKICARVRAKMARMYDKRVIVVRKESLDAAKDFQDGFFDFVYIDANHRYEFVRDDLAAWWPKLRVGGLFAGHDYVERRDYGVIAAVNEFRQHHGVNDQLFTTPADNSPSWYWIKR